MYGYYMRETNAIFALCDCVLGINIIYDVYFKIRIKIAAQLI